jgi:hypothetical protein
MQQNHQLHIVIPPPSPCLTAPPPSCAFPKPSFALAPSLPHPPTPPASANPASPPVPTNPPRTLAPHARNPPSKSGPSSASSPSALSCLRKSSTSAKKKPRTCPRAPLSATHPRILRLQVGTSSLRTRIKSRCRRFPTSAPRRAPRHSGVPMP